MEPDPPSEDLTVTVPAPTPAEIDQVWQHLNDNLDLSAAIRSVFRPVEYTLGHAVTGRWQQRLVEAMESSVTAAIDSIPVEQADGVTFQSTLDREIQTRIDRGRLTATTPSVQSLPRSTVTDQYLAFTSEHLGEPASRYVNLREQLWDDVAATMRTPISTPPAVTASTEDVLNAVQRAETLSLLARQGVVSGQVVNDAAGRIIGIARLPVSYGTVGAHAASVSGSYTPSDLPFVYLPDVDRIRMRSASYQIVRVAGLADRLAVDDPDDVQLPYRCNLWCELEMTAQEAPEEFRGAMLDMPNGVDWLPFLVYSDWLEENNRTLEAKRLRKVVDALKGGLTNKEKS